MIDFKSLQGEFGEKKLLTNYISIANKYPVLRIAQFINLMPKDVFMAVGNLSKV